MKVQVLRPWNVAGCSLDSVLPSSPVSFDGANFEKSRSDLI